jgi:ankyrin repeat protein
MDDPSSPPPRKRSAADAFGRLATTIRVSGDRTATTTATTTVTTRAGGSTGFLTKCPLCGTVSAKTYALGRGIAAHLHAIHTPWKPTKLSRKIDRRQWEQEQRRRRRGRNEQQQKQQQQRTVSIPHDDASAVKPPDELLKEYTPTRSELDEWDAKVSDTVQQVERDFHAAVILPPTRGVDSHDSNEAAHTTTTTTPTTTTEPSRTVPSMAIMSGGTPSPLLVSYKESLPPFLQAAAQGKLDTLSKMVMEVDATTGTTNTNNNHNHNSNNTTTTTRLMDLLQQTDRHGSMAEHWAAGGGHLECLKLLLETKQKMVTTTSTDDNDNDDDTEPPVVLLVRPRKKQRRRDGKTCLHYAARNGQLDCVRYLVENQKMDLHEASGEGTTPLHMACYGGHLPVVQYLVEQSSKSSTRNTTTTTTTTNPALATNDWGCTSAHWVAMTLNKNAEQVAQLCTYLQNNCGVPFGTRQHQGHSPLHKAAQRGNRHVLEWMASASNCQLSPAELQAAAAPDQGGHTPSEIWRLMGNEESVAEWMNKSQGW